MNEPKETFRTHSNYLLAFDHLLCDPIAEFSTPFYQLLHKRILTSKILPKNQVKGYDNALLKKSLHNAWGTEFLMLTSRDVIDEDELIRLSNNWNCIQAYYIFYHCTQALAISRKQVRPDSHSKTQQIFMNTWSKRNSCVSPWTLSATPTGYNNIDPNVTIDDKIHSWSQCNSVSAWSLGTKVLRTTRDDALKEKLKISRDLKMKKNKKEWNTEEEKRLAQGKKPRKTPKFPRPILTTAEKRGENSSLRDFTIMDYLYRLRLKTNYEDANMFTDGPEDEFSSQQVRHCLCRIASSTLFLHELAIRNIVGSKVFASGVNAWIKKNIPIGMKTGIVKRVGFLQ